MVYIAAVGRDWVPMRVRAGVTADELARRIAAQRASFLATGWSPGGAGGEVELSANGTGPAGHDAAAVWRSADEDLRDVVEMPADGAGWPSFRVAVIGANPLLPPSWRDAAWSSLSPAQARAEFARWRWWYAEITAGRMGSYLDRLRLWEESRELAACRQAALEAVAMAGARPVARATSPAFLAARAGLAGLPVPPPALEPGPVPTGDEPMPPADLEQAWAGLRAYRRALAAAIVEVNRTGPRSLRLSTPPRVGEPAGEVRDPWLEDFFTWAAPYLSDGCGLYLWA
ncbi:hypothetical protein Cci01nite_15480 [Catellatospora citrea]|uniref:Uncharacterized protein n=1 Tax=Catellatospora citrea TaxID=53366 RepID=A0A8J3KIE0_9ACTN|nr:hypothetical protein Cci01nite_15480 [Catellatospora citrea]